MSGVVFFHPHLRVFLGFAQHAIRCLDAGLCEFDACGIGFDQLFPGVFAFFDLGSEMLQVCGEERVSQLVELERGERDLQ